MKDMGSKIEHLLTKVDIIKFIQATLKENVEHFNPYTAVLVKTDLSDSEFQPVHCQKKMLS